MKIETYKEASLQNNNGTIVIYYFNKTKMRFKTGVSIRRIFTRTKKWDEWDYLKHTINAKAENYTKNIEKLNNWLNIANSFLRKRYDEGYFVTAKQLESYLFNYNEEQEEKLYAELIPMYKIFYKKKEDEFRASNKLASLKDYTSLLNSFIDYEVDLKRVILLKSINEDWLSKFKLWLKGKRPDTYLSEGKLIPYKTKGNLGSKTLHKRISSFATFWRFVRKKRLVTDVSLLEEFLSTIKPGKKSKTTLTVDEIFSLYQKKFENEIYNVVKDLFVFTCLTGLRYSDLRNFDYAFVKEHFSETGLVYQRKSIKTEDSSGVTIQVPLCETALEILRRYDNDLSKIMMTNVKLNSYLHKLLKESNLCNGLTELKGKLTGEYLKRYEAISWHQGRDSFITNLVDNTPINELMKYTGHKKITTLQGYIDPSRHIRMDYINNAFKFRQDLGSNA